MHMENLALRDDGLIYDVGIQNGEETTFYLDKVFRVVGLEADPPLIRALRESLNRPPPAVKSGLVADETDAGIGRLELEDSVLRGKIEDLHQSRSWRVTRPLRTLDDAIRELRLWICT
jgi:hypothetical protein